MILVSTICNIINTLYVGNKIEFLRLQQSWSNFGHKTLRQSSIFLIIQILIGFLGSYTTTHVQCWFDWTHMRCGGPHSSCYKKGLANLHPIFSRLNGHSFQIKALPNNKNCGMETAFSCQNGCWKSFTFDLDFSIATRGQSEKGVRTNYIFLYLKFA